MTKTQTASDLKALWLQADNAKLDFYNRLTTPWTPEEDAKYLELRDCADRLYHEWVAEQTGKSAEEVAYAVNESMHSRFD
jgi:hypothetical protein